jgi:myosin III
MDTEERLRDFNLNSSRQYRYLRVPDKPQKGSLEYVRDDRLANVAKFKDFESALVTLDISQDTIESIYKIIAAILLLGEVRFKESSADRKAALEEPQIASEIANLLKIDDKKFQWALVNYCLIIQGSVEKQRMSAGLILFL